MTLAIRVFLLLTFLLVKADAFSLLGPYAPWMDQAKSYRLPGDIGGPMNIGEGYRWNVPVVTYGFDRSFLDYYGSNGVQAVEAAFQVINQLPTASLINPTNYPLDAWRINFQAQALGLIDLKSTVLSLLLEQSGLASPERYTWCIRDYSYAGGHYSFAVVRRNFDPLSGFPSSYVNETLLSYQILQTATSPPPSGVFCDASEFTVDPQATFNTSVAGFGQGVGSYATGLSQDDAGGLKYLLGGNQIRFESLLPDVHGAGTTTNLVRSALRPGIEKVLFARHPYGALSGDFQPFTNRWTDVYYAGDSPAYQQVERVTSRPDILFKARDLGVDKAFERTGTSNWVNHANENGNWGGSGPGVIQPPIDISLNNVGRIYLNFPPFNLDEAEAIGMQGWGTFDGSTNQAIIYPASPVAFQPTQVRFKLVAAGRTNEFLWSLTGVPYGRFSLQTSTNLNDWEALASITNSGTPFNYTFSASSNETRRFFRTFSE